MSDCSQNKIHVAGLIGDSIVDGPGLRAVVFVQGCDKRCPGCHNPEAQSFEGGTAYTPEEIFEKIRQNPLCRGVTFSGGEPLCQAEALIPLAKMLKEAGYELAMYTGDIYEQVMAAGGAKAELVRLVDVLIDGPFILEQKSLLLRFKGSKNQRILDIPASLEQGSAVLVTAERWVGEQA